MTHESPQDATPADRRAGLATWEPVYTGLSSLYAALAEAEKQSLGRLLITSAVACGVREFWVATYWEGIEVNHMRWLWREWLERNPTRESTEYSIPAWCQLPTPEHETASGCWGISSGQQGERGEDYCKGCEYYGPRREGDKTD
jgi:hypothetical protein